MKNKNYIYSNNIGKKATALILTIALAGMGMCGCGLPGKTAADVAMDTVTEAFTDDDAALLSKLIATQVGTTDESVDKEESVYVVADANGASKEVIVSDWLKNTSGEKTIVDQSDLTDIKNIKGDETFENDGENITWNADGSSIYYQGTTDKELPVSMNITYYLDGQEMTADEIAGKSGNVTIRFDYTNNEKVETSVDGKDTEVYVPFTVMSTMILPTDKFANINVTNGKVMSEGNNNIVMGLAFPGLTESLDLDKEELEEKDISIPDYVEVNAITSDFQLDMTLSVILSDALSDIHLTDSIDLSELEDGMNDLTDATTKLEDGSGALRDGVQELSDKTGEFSNGAKELYDGVVKYTDGVSQIESGVNTLKEGSGALSSGANELSAGAATLNEKVQAISLPSGSLTEEQKNQISSAVAADPLLSAGASQLSKGITQAALGSVASSINSSDSIKAAASSVRPSFDNMVAAGVMTSEQADQLANGIASGILNNVAGKVSGAAESENSTATQACLDALTSAAQKGAIDGASAAAGSAASYSGMIDQLKAATSQLADGAKKVADGAGQLDSGVGTLQSGVNTLNGNSAALVDGASKLYDGTGKLTDGVSELLTGANDLNDGMVRFDEEGISKLTDAFDSDGKNVLDRLDATMEAAKGYHTFTSLADGQEGSVKFIIRTGAVK